MRRTAVLVSVALLFVACGGDDRDDAAVDDSSTSSSPNEAETDWTSYRSVVEALTDPAMEGRDNQTSGSELAQSYLIEQLEGFAEPLGKEYRQTFDVGANVIGVIRGSELPDEYVILGAHYDHLGRDCPTASPDDDICEGAADNAAGVAAVMEIGQRIASGDAPRRSVVLAFWDAEEDGLLGAKAYVADPLVPLEATTAYLNWDIQGANLLPSLARTTIMVGAETGGSALQAAADRATEASDLETVGLSLLFGQGRSDHAVFAEAGVPTVFFTDANSGCYHTAQDDLSNLDFGKLAEQIETGAALAQDLIATDTTPTFVADAPIATYEDAQSMLAVTSRAQPDFGRFPATEQQAAEQFLVALQAMVDAGPEAFDDDAVGVLLGGSAALVTALAEGPCDGFLDG